MRKLITYKKIGRIGNITLNNEAMDLDTINELIEILKLSIKNQDICVILKSSKENFSFGEDLRYAYKLMTDVELKSEALQEIYGFQEVTSLIRKHPGIIIVGYRGWVIGGGFEFTLFCDLRIATTNTIIWLPELDVGMFFSNASTKALSWLIGASRAKEMMIFGKKIPAQKALEYGIISDVCEPNELNTVLRKKARMVVKKSPLALTYAKRLINQGSEISFDEAIYKEIQTLIETGNSHHAKIRIESFLNRNKNPS